MNKALTFLLSILLLVSCTTAPPKDEVMSVTIGDQSVTEGEAPKEKTDKELIQEAVTGAIDLTKDLIRQHNLRDSLRLANREKMYGYRIGFPIKDDDAVFEVYERLGLTDNMYVLKQSRKEYYLFYCPGGSEKELNDSLESFRAGLPDEFKNNVQVKNMTELCTNSKQKLMLGENLSKRKVEYEIPCLICDK